MKRGLLLWLFQPVVVLAAGANPGPGVPAFIRLAVADTTISSQVVLTDSLQASLPEKTSPFSPLASNVVSDNDIISGNLNKYMLGFISDFSRDNTKHLQAIQSKSEPYFVMFDNVFRKFGIPDEMKYLAVIESGLNSNAVSRVGAVGTWQFMAGTARLMGLRVNRKHDDRRNLYKSTEAAAQYLTQLYGSLQDWLLVVAAYNCGLGGVLRAINASGSSNFWDLKNYLPAESRKHVLKFLATAYIMERFANFFGLDNSSGANVGSITSGGQPAFLSSADLANTKTVEISGKYSMPVIAKWLSMDINELNRLNPGFNQMISGNINSYDLRLPSGKMDLFKTNMNNILNESVQLMMENNRKIASAAVLNNYPEAKPIPAAAIPVPAHHRHKHSR